MQTRLLSKSVESVLCANEGLLALQISLVFGVKPPFVGRKRFVIIAQLILCLCNIVIVKCLCLHTLFCVIALLLSVSRVETHSGAFGNANIVQVDARCAMSGVGCGNGTFAFDSSNLFNFFNFHIHETLIIKCEKSEMLSEIFSNFAFGKSRIRASVPETVA